MKSILSILLSMLGSIPVFSQDHAGGGVSIDPLGHNTMFAEAYDQKTGKPLTQVNKQVFGSSVLNDNWGKGEVKLKNGLLLKDVELQFDLYSNELHFRKDNIGYSFVDSVKWFSIEFKDSMQMRSVIFRSGFPAIQKNNGASFYQVVADGKKIQLLNYITKEVRENYQYLGAVRNDYQLKEAYYIYDVTSGTIKSVNLKKNSLLKAMPALADSINDFANKNKTNLRSENEVIELVEFLNR